MIHESQDREVLAHLSGIRVILSGLTWVGLAAFLIYMLFTEIADHRFSKLKEHIGLSALSHIGYIILLPLMLAGLLALLPSVIRVSREFLRFGGSALWVERGRLVYVERRALDVPLAELASVSESKSARGADVIVLHLKDGREKFLAVTFVESNHDVIEVIRQKLGQT